MSGQTVFEGQRMVLQADAAVATLRLFNPPMGCMDDTSEQELARVLALIEAEPAWRVVVLTGRDEGVFVRHYDVAVLAQRASQMAARGMRFSAERPVPEALLHRCLAQIEASDRIFIAAINGQCMGGGYELALACDLRYAQSGQYRIGLPEVNIGLLPGAGGTQKLARLMGRGPALEAMLLGRTFWPDEARAAGLVGDCVPDVLAHAHQVAVEIAGKPPRAVQHIKHLVRRAERAEAAAGLAEERTLFCDTMVQPEALQRMNGMVAGQHDITDR